MIPWDQVLQWCGAILVVHGYFKFGKVKMMDGARWTGTGAAMFLIWGLEYGHPGVAALNFVIVAAMLQQLWNGRHGEKS